MFFRSQTFLLSVIIGSFSGLALGISTANAAVNTTAPSNVTQVMDEPTRIHFQVTAEEKVPGNTMRASLRLEVKNKQPAPAAKELNQKLQTAMQSLRADKLMHIQTSQYFTQQQYDEKGRPKDWIVSVELTISSEQWNTLSEHIAELQSKGWLFSNVDFEVSAEQRKAAEQRLMVRALADWKGQAEQIAKQLELKKWKLGNVDISRSGTIQPLQKMYRSRATLSADMAEAAPAMAGSDTTLSIVVNGELVAN
ncbi:MAG: SIMPL domain-containing protein [Pseudomonadota bacterium]